MFKRENRLVLGIKFSNSRIFTTPQFILKEKANDLGVNRFGIVVSKKVDGRAVVRNRVKRLFRTKILSMGGKISDGHDILLVAKKEILGKTKEENYSAIEKALGKAGILRIND